MKRFLIHSRLGLIVLSISLAFNLSACKKNPSKPPPVEPKRMEELQIPADFNFETVRQVQVELTVSNPQGRLQPGIRTQIFNGNPELNSSRVLTAGLTDERGQLITAIPLSPYQDTIWALTDQLGIINRVALPVQDGTLRHHFNALQDIGFNRTKPPRTSNNDELHHFPEPRRTDVNMSVIIERITGIEVAPGAEIACLTPDDIVAGADTLTPTPPWGLAVWGDDSSTEPIDGFRAGEPLRFKYWDPELELELDAQSTVVHGSGTYSNNGFAVFRLHIDAPTGFAYQGSWDEEGRPDYLVENLVLDGEFTRELSRLLPEKIDLSAHHPDYLNLAQESVLAFDREAEVFVSFLHDGTTLPCALGYYTYPTDQPPQSPADIDRLYIAFPNASLIGGGGRLNAGNRVSLGTIEAGSTLSWFIVPGGWNGQNVSFGASRFYANPEFNPEAAPELRRHFILLNDPRRLRLVLGCEVLPRDSSEVDDDFNDLVFVIETEPLNSYSLEHLAEFDATPPDRDGDGVIDAIDSNDDDNRRAFLSRFPLDGDITLAFEDEWPQRGDYDFNDLVVGCAFETFLNAGGCAVGLLIPQRIKAVGTWRPDGFGYSLPVPAAQVSRVIGSRLNRGYIQISGNGTESGPDNAVIIAFDDALALMTPAAGYRTINTEAGSPLINPYSHTLQIEFNTPIRLDSLGAPPFNPFLIIDRNRGKELHPAGLRPTSQVNQDFFGQVDDRTDIGTGRLYKSRFNLPWALIIPTPWDHPLEARELIQAYPDFGPWAESAGNSPRNWFNSNIQQEHIWSAP